MIYFAIQSTWHVALICTFKNVPYIYLSCPWRHLGIFHPCGFCHLVALLLCCRNRKQTYENLFLKVERAKWETTGRVPSILTHKLLNSLLNNEFFLKWLVEVMLRKLHSNPIKLVERAPSSKTSRWAKGRAWKTIVMICHWIGTYRKQHHRCVAVDSPLTPQKVICFCFWVACLVSAVDSAQCTPACRDRREQ